MSSIAQKLCEEICEEESMQSFVQDDDFKSPLTPSTSGRYRGRPTTSILVEKKRVINNVLPRTNTYRNKVINKFKSKETLLKKKLVDVALNTIVTGPLKCDNDCVTLVRTRDNKCSCGQKRKKAQLSAKEIQTLNFKRNSTFDKASAQSINTVNCGVQSNKFDGAIKKSSNVKLVYDIDVQTSITKGTNRKMQDKSASTPFKKNSNIMGARRWALSKGPARGPDF